MVEIVNDTEAAKSWLLSNPTGMSGFDEKYGAGAASDILQGTYRTPEQIAVAQQADQESKGFWANVAEIPSALARGIIGAPTEATQTLVNANKQPASNLDLLTDRSVAMRERQTGTTFTDEQRAEVRNNIEMAYASQGMGFGEPVDYSVDKVVKAVGLENVLPAPETMTGGLTEGISQFVTGIAMLGGTGGLAGTMLKGAVIDFSMFEPTEKNLANLGADAEWTGPIIDDALNTLATNPNDTEWENRTRNALLGGLTGLALEGVIKGIKFAAVGRKANTEIKTLGKISDETAAELDTAHSEVKALDEEVKAQEAGHLLANPDGTFTAPDGMTFKPEGDKLVEVPAKDTAPAAPEQAPEAPAAPLADEPINPEVAQTAAAPTLDAPTGAADQVDVPTAQAEAPVQTPAEILAEQAANVTVKVAPKAPMIDKEAFRAILKRTDEMSPFDIKNIDEGGVFNFERMDGPVDAGKLIDSYDEVLRETAGDKMGWANPQSQDVVLKDALKYTAEMTNTNVNSLIKNLNATETMTRDLAAKIVAGKMALQSTGREVLKAASILEDAVAKGAGSDELERKLVDIMQLHAEVQVNVKGLQTSAARATAAGRIVTADVNLGNTLDTLSVFGGSKQIRRLASQIRKSSTPAQRAGIVRKAVERKWLGVLNEYWINQILSGYQTHSLNITASVVNLFIRPAERLIGSGFIGNRREASVALRQYYYMMTSAHEALAMAARSGYNQRAVLDASAKIENGLVSGQPRAMSAANLGIQNKFAGTAVDVIGKLTTLPSRALGTEDEFFKQISFRANLKANIATDAAMMSPADLAAMGYSSRDAFVIGEFEKATFNKISAEEKWQELVLLGRVADDPEVKAEFISRTIGNARESTSKYAVAALKEARDTTFTKPLEKGTLAADFQQFANRHPVMRQITPFIQTPMNIMGQVWERTPALNRLKKSYKDALNSSDQAVKAEAVGKMVTGAATYALLTGLAMQGRITGGGPTDPKLATLWRNSKDWQPYSINVGSVDQPEWISYQRLDPWATPFGIVGDIAEMVETGKMADTDSADYISMSIAALGNNLVSKTYLQGISDFVSLLNSKDRPQDVQSFLRNRAVSLMPYSGMAGQISNATDDYTRDVRSLLDGYRNRIPTSRQGLAIKYDWVSGQPTDVPEKLLGFIGTKEVSDEDQGIALVNSEMRKLGYGFTGATRKIGGVELTAAQFQEWNMLIGSTKLGGKTLSERMVTTIESNRYNVDGDDYNLVTPQESHRVAMLNDHVSSYRRRAQQELLKSYPELRQAVREYDRYVKTVQSGRDAGERPATSMFDLLNQ